MTQEKVLSVVQHHCSFSILVKRLKYGGEAGVNLRTEAIPFFLFDFYFPYENYTTLLFLLLSHKLERPRVLELKSLHLIVKTVMI